eukprot:883430-Pelagomonas_calceolata.AAC.3
MDCCQACHSTASSALLAGTPAACAGPPPPSSTQHFLAIVCYWTSGWLEVRGAGAGEAETGSFVWRGAGYCAPMKGVCFWTAAQTS